MKKWQQHTKKLSKWIIIPSNRLSLTIFLSIKFLENKLKIIDYNRLWTFILGFYCLKNGSIIIHFQSIILIVFVVSWRLFSADNKKTNIFEYFVWNLSAGFVKQLFSINQWSAFRCALVYKNKRNFNFSISRRPVCKNLVEQGLHQLSGKKI